MGLSHKKAKWFELLFRLNPTCQWPDKGSFELKKTSVSEKILESPYPNCLTGIWKDQIKKYIQRNITASFRDCLNNMQGQKLE